MSPTLKALVAVAVVIACVLAGAATFAGTALVRGGVASLVVRAPDGPNLRLHVPGAVLSAVATVGGHLADRSHHAVSLHHSELYEDAGPLLGAILTALAEAPDATLVEVSEGEDRVRVVKRDGLLAVRVVDGHEGGTVEVRLPIRTARLVAGRLFE